MFACLVIFLLPNTVFAWFEYVTSLIKIFLFLIIITLSLALVLGAGPNGYVHHGETWTDLPAFLNGFSVSLEVHPFDFTPTNNFAGIRQLCTPRYLGCRRSSLYRYHGR
jgi:amino acid permease